MASAAAQQIVELYSEWKQKLAMNDGMSLEELRELFDGWGSITAEPADVEFKDATLYGVDCKWAIPKGADESRVLICCHGGGFVVGSSASHRKMFGHIAKAVGCAALVLDYTRAPENPHPGIVEEAVAVYSGLLEGGYKPEHIATIGDSAGGNLCTSVLLFGERLGYPMPAACVPLSPWYDMEGTGETLTTNAEKDALVNKDILMGMAEMFLAGKNPRGPIANPLYADLENLPPTLIQVGEYEGLLDDSRRFYERAKAAGVDVELQVFPEMQHVFHFMAGNAPEADDAIAKIAQFLRPRLGLA